MTPQANTETWPDHSLSVYTRCLLTTSVPQSTQPQLHADFLKTSRTVSTHLYRFLTSPLLSAVGTCHSGALGGRQGLVLRGPQAGAKCHSSTRLLVSVSDALTVIEVLPSAPSPPLHWVLGPSSHSPARHLAFRPFSLLRTDTVEFPPLVCASPHLLLCLQGTEEKGGI